MTCRECGHDDEAHSDRAFIPCIGDEEHPHRCWCPGFSVRELPQVAA
jgi:hypothetical protein